MATKRQYTPEAKRKRDKKFIENLAKRENPIHFAMVLPDDVEKLQDISWAPDKFERMAAWLDEARKRWDKEDDERRRQRLKEILEAVERDRHRHTT